MRDAEQAAKGEPVDLDGVSRVPDDEWLRNKFKEFAQGGGLEHVRRRVSTVADIASRVAVPKVKRAISGSRRASGWSCCLGAPLLRLSGLEACEGDDLIDEHDMRILLRKLDIFMTDFTFYKLMRAIDPDGDGVDTTEFLDFLGSVSDSEYEMSNLDDHNTVLGGNAAHRVVLLEESGSMRQANIDGIDVEVLASQKAVPQNQHDSV